MTDTLSKIVKRLNPLVEIDMFVSDENGVFIGRERCESTNRSDEKMTQLLDILNSHGKVVDQRVFNAEGESLKSVLPPAFSHVKLCIVKRKGHTNLSLYTFVMEELKFERTECDVFFYEELFAWKDEMKAKHGGYRVIKQ